MFLKKVERVVANPSIWQNSCGQSETETEIVARYENG